jgi:hypothetical protein
MDTGPGTRKNPGVLRPGALRRQIARTLQTAYADGRLSEDTFVRRLDQVLQDRLIDPLRLVGDLSLRAPTSGMRTRLKDGMNTLIGKFDRAPNKANEEWTLLALEWDSDPSELLVGRHCSCDIVISDLSVSRRHARLVARDGRWILQDLASTNGTVLNGLRVGRCELRAGDRLQLGEHHLLID